MKISALAPWFGGKRTLAADIVQQLGPHRQYFEPFCGSMAVLMAKPVSGLETVNDLHGDLINLARVIASPEDGPELYDRLGRVVMTEDMLLQADEILSQEMMSLPDADPAARVRHWQIDRAYWYFIACWQGRNGTAGTERLDYQIAVRWTNSGGSPTVRWRNALDSMPAWHRRLSNVVILNRDAFKIIDRLEDAPKTAIYVDTPYLHETRSTGSRKNGAGGRYLHDFDEPAAGELFASRSVDRHEELAAILKGYKNARIVVSYYDCDRVRSLYDGWTFITKTMNKHLYAVGGRGGRMKKAPEVLIVNGPARDNDLRKELEPS